VDWLEDSKPHLISSHDELPFPRTRPDDLIDICLANVQGLLAKCPESSPDPDEDRDDYIKDDCHTVCDLTTLFKLDHLVERLNDLLVLFASSSANHDVSIKRIDPFLTLYTKVAKIQLESHAHWVKALFKFNYVLCSVLQTLCKQGFCKPPDVEQDGESGDGTAEMTDGVGMGEGSGADNVSKEIQEESQVEGLQGDDTNDNQSRDNKDDDAIEMNQDFGGEMEDVPDDGDDQDNEDEDEDENDAEPEEQVGDLDASDPNAVDEKFWGDEKGPENSNEAEQKTGEDRSEESKGESDVVAKEGREESKGKEKNEQGEQKEDEAAQQEPEDGLPDEDGPDIDPDHPDASGAPMDEHIPDADALELPDDMDLGGEENAMDIDDIDDRKDDPEDAAVEPEGIDNDVPDDDLPERDELTAEPQNSEEEPQAEPKEDELDVPAQAEHAEGENEELQEDKTTVPEPDISNGDGAPTSDKQFNTNSEEGGEGGEVGTSSGMSGQTTAIQDDSAPQNEYVI